MRPLNKNEALVFAMITAAERTGAPSPTNREILDAIGYKSKCMPTVLVSALVEKGWISAETGQNWRQVTVLHNTAEEAPEAEPPPPPKYKPPLEMYIPPPIPRRTGPRVKTLELIGLPMAPSRDPCTRCGIPGSKGCNHYAPHPPHPDQRAINSKQTKPRRLGGKWT